MPAGLGRRARRTNLAASFGDPNYQTRENPERRPAKMRSTPASNRQSADRFQGRIPCLHAAMSSHPRLPHPPFCVFGTGTAHAATTLKISHQFPGGTIDKGDFRDRLCRMFAAEVAKRSGGDIAARDLSELLADQDQRAILGDAQRRARHQPLSPALCRRRIAGDQYRPDARPGRDLRSGPALEEGAGRQGADRLPRRQGHHPADLDLAGRRRRQPLQADRGAGRRQGHEGARRLARDGHGAADRGRRRAVGALERNLCGDADRRLRCRHHLLHQPDLVPARGSLEIAHLGRRRVLLVHAGAA